MKQVVAVLALVVVGSSLAERRAPYFGATVQGKTKAGDTPIRVSIPPCVSLSVDPGSPRLGGRWSDLKLVRKTIKDNPQFGNRAACVQAAYDGRFTPEQFEQLQDGRLAVGMPIEFAVLALGRSMQWRDAKQDRYDWRFPGGPFGCPQSPGPTEISLRRLRAASRVTIVASPSGRIAAFRLWGPRFAEEKAKYDEGLMLYNDGRHAQALAGRML